MVCGERSFPACMLFEPGIRHAVNRRRTPSSCCLCEQSISISKRGCPRRQLQQAAIRNRENRRLTGLASQDSTRSRCRRPDPAQLKKHHKHPVRCSSALPVEITIVIDGLTNSSSIPAGISTGHCQHAVIRNGNRGVACAEFAKLEKAAVSRSSSSYVMAVQKYCGFHPASLYINDSFFRTRNPLTAGWLSADRRH